jgi:hypothetical protein
MTRSFDEAGSESFRGSRAIRKAWWVACKYRGRYVSRSLRLAVQVRIEVEPTEDRRQQGRELLGLVAGERAARSVGIHVLSPA